MSTIEGLHFVYIVELSQKIFFPLSLSQCRQYCTNWHVNQEQEPYAIAMELSQKSSFLYPYHSADNIAPTGTSTRNKNHMLLLWNSLKNLLSSILITVQTILHQLARQPGTRTICYCYGTLSKIFFPLSLSQCRQYCTNWHVNLLYPYHSTDNIAPTGTSTRNKNHKLASTHGCFNQHNYNYIIQLAEGKPSTSPYQRL